MLAGNRLAVSLNPQWLHALPTSAFPVTVDPTLTYPQTYATSIVSYSSKNDPAKTNAAYIGVDSTGSIGTAGAVWRAAFYFNAYDTFVGQNPAYRVYYAAVALSPYQTSGTQTAVDLYAQGSKPTAESQIGASNDPLLGTSTDPPPNGGAFGLAINATDQVDTWVSGGLKDQWFGLTGTETGSILRQYQYVWLNLTIEQPPNPSRVTNISANQVLATTTPTLNAVPITISQAEYNAAEWPMYDYQITTGTAPGLGLVIDSGEMEDSSACYTGQSGCTDVPPSWQVPPGALQQGVEYHVWVLTDWVFSNPFRQGEPIPETTPPSGWGVPFTVNLGLGKGGPSPTDQVGSVPGQSSTPAQGAPSPGLPGSSMTVNMTDGNLSFSVGTEQLSTVGGGLGLSFTYNSLNVGTADTEPGLQGYYYNKVGGSSVLVDQRVDPTVSFFPSSSWLPAAQMSTQASTTWIGILTLPVSGGINSGDSIALGEISSDGMTIALGTPSCSTSYPSSYLTDTGPHAAQSEPIWGPSFTNCGTSTSALSMPITITWTHASTDLPTAEIYLEDTTPAAPQVFAMSPSWLTHSPSVLSPGWTLNQDAGTASWVGLADRGGQVTAYAADGSAFNFTSTGGGNYLPPAQDPTANLHVDPSGDFILTDGAGALTYTFNPSGSLISVKSTTDDLKPAALQYCYSGSGQAAGTSSSACLPSATSCPTAQPSITQASQATLLRTITDPVSGCQATLVYGGDTTSGSSACPAAWYAAAPTGMLCAVDFWDGQSTQLQYNSYGELAVVVDPGGVIYQFAYNSNGQMTAEADPLAFEANSSGARTDCASGYCSTEVHYNTAGQVSAITQPAPLQSQDGTPPERGYCYGYAQASITSGATQPTCATPTSHTTSVGVAGLSPAVGYVEQIVYDQQQRIVATRDSAGETTTYTWNSSDQLISATTPAGIETSTGYNNQGEAVNSYGPAPAADFQANGQPLSGDGVATASTQYDGGMSGLAAAWYPNTTLSGTPAYHEMSNLAENWAGNGSPSSGSSDPSLIPSSGFSGNLTGLVTLPQPGRINFTGDGGTVSVDGHQVLNQANGPYPGAVVSDQPSDWWRLGEGTGATTAADSAGSDVGHYSTSGVTLGQPGPLADGDSTAAAFNGSSGAVTAADTPALEMSNTEPFSVEAWVKIPSTGFIYPIASKLADNSSLQGWEMGTYEGEPYLILVNSWSSNAIDVVATSAISTNAWHLITATYDGSSKAAGVSIYVDGQKVATSTADDTLTGSSASNAPLTIGERVDGPFYLNGSLADVSLYPDVALTATRVSAHYYAGYDLSETTQSPIIYNTPYPEAVEADNPTAYWRLNEPSGTTTASDSWGSNNGTYNNVTLGQVGGLLGDSSTSASFNGTSSYVSLPQHLFRPGQPTTVEAWINTTSTGPIYGIQNSTIGGSAPSTWDPLLYVGANGDLYGGIANALLSGASAGPVNNGAWHLVALSYDGAGNVALYLDGAQIASGSGANSYELGNPYDEIGGGYFGGSWPQPPTSGWGYFKGNIQDVSVYPQSLSPSQVQTEYRAGAWSPYPEAVAADNAASMWRLTETSGTVAADSIGANSGTYAGSVIQGINGPLPGDPAPAASFWNNNGVGGDVQLPPNLVTNTSGAFSVEAWFELGSDGPIFGAQGQPVDGSAPANYWPMLYVGADEHLHGGVYGAALSASTNVDDLKWHYAVLTDNGAGGVKLYLDGSLVASGTGGTTQAVTYDQIGAAYISNSWPSNPLGSTGWDHIVGDIADVGLYTYPLDPAQVAAHYQAGQTSPAPSVYSTIHTIAVTDQQYVANGGFTVSATSSGATFDPNYGLVTQTTDADGNVTATSYSAGNGIVPQYGLATTVTQNPGGLNLATTTSYEAPGTGSYLRVTGKTLPAGNEATYVNYCGYATDPTCVSPEQPGAWATACGVTAGASQYGLVAEKTDPAPASGSGNALVEQFLYDQDGRQVGIRDGTVNTINTAGWDCTTYDAAGRITSQSWPAFNGQSARTVTYCYYGDSGCSAVTSPFMSTVTDTNWGSASVHSTVDLLDRTTSYTDIWGNTTTTAYDQVGRIVMTSGPEGAVASSYDPGTGRPTTTVLSPYVRAVQISWFSCSIRGSMAAW